MAGDWQDFGYEGKSGTCLWCGRKLRRESVMATEGEPGAVRVGTSHLGGWYRKPAAKLGGYQDDSFCGLRCGYQFGVRQAELGRRLVRKG